MTLPSFKKHYSIPIDAGQSINADLDEIGLKNERSKELKEEVDKHILARDKSLIADQLPGKKDLVQL